MKLTYALLCILMITGCEGNKSSPPEPMVVSPAPAPAPTTTSGPSSTDEDTLNDGLPSGPSDLGPSETERKFIQAARETINAYNLPTSAHFEKKGDASKKAKLFVGLRCSSMLRKMKASPKSFTNLYDDSELGSVCDAKDIRLLPGQAVSSFETTGILFSRDRRSIEISVRQDYTVSGYRTYLINDPLIGSLDSSETIATIEGDRRIRSYKSGSSRSLEVAESSGRMSYSEQETFTSQTRDGMIRKTIVVRGMRNNRTMMIREVSMTPAPGFLGHRRDKSIACVVQMLNPDGTIYAQAHESAACFPLTFSFL